MKSLLLLLALILLIPQASALTNTTNATCDTYVQQGSPDFSPHNWGNVWLFMQSANEIRPIIKYEIPSLSGTISEIYVEYYVYEYTNNGFPTQNVGTYRIWDNRSDNFTASLSGTSWNNATTNVPWTTSGGDFDSTLLDEIPITSTGWKKFYIYGTNVSNNINVAWGDSFSLIYKPVINEDLRGFKAKSTENNSYKPRMIITYSTDVAPNITSYTSTDFSEYENVLFQLNATADQVGNWTLYADGSLVQSNISVSTFSYVNSTALEGLHNYTAIVTNVNGSDSVQWNVTIVSNSFHMDVTHFNRTNLSYNMIFETSNYTAGITQIDIEYPYTNNGNSYSLHHYANDTQVGSSQTATATNQSLWFNNTVSNLPESTYYFKETEETAIETFVVAAGAFAAVVVAGAAVVSRRVRRGASAFWNRRIRRR